jgi:hypothetical protein
MSVVSLFQRWRAALEPPVATSCVDGLPMPARLGAILTIALGITMAVECLVAWFALAISAKGYRLEFVLKGILLTPVRYLVILFDFVTMLRFAADIWIFKNTRWRK